MASIIEIVHSLVTSSVVLFPKTSNFYYRSPCKLLLTLNLLLILVLTGLKVTRDSEAKSKTFLILSLVTGSTCNEAERLTLCLLYFIVGVFKSFFMFKYFQNFN